jgi:hypothetical protein
VKNRSARVIEPSAILVERTLLSARSAEPTAFGPRSDDEIVLSMMLPLPTEEGASSVPVTALGAKSAEVSVSFATLADVTSPSRSSAGIPFSLVQSTGSSASFGFRSAAERKVANALNSFCVNGSKASSEKETAPAATEGFGTSR